VAVGDVTQSSEPTSEASDRKTRVVDDESFSHQRRLHAIHDGHDRVIEVRNAVEERLIEGVVSEYHARRYYRSAIESFLMELLPLLRNDNVELEKDYANGVEVGEISVEPPEELVSFARANIDRLPPGGSVPTTWTVSIDGLSTILDLPSPIRHQFTVAFHTGGGVEQVNRSVEVELDRRLLDSAFHIATEAMEEAEMGLKIENTDREAEFDYEDLFPGGDDE